MDEETKKRVLRLINYGLYIMTAASQGEIAAGAVNWLSQASFKPPLVMAAVKSGSRLHELIEKSRGFVVNILREDQKSVAEAFFAPSKVEGTTINGYRFEPAPRTGAPILIDLPAWFEVLVTDVVKRGDHTIFVGEVVEVGLREAEARSLVLRDTGWFYGG